MLRNYYSLESLETLLSKPTILAVINHTSGTISTRVDSVSSGLVRLQEQDLREVWEIKSGDIENGIEQNCHWRKSSEFLFVSTAVNIINDSYENSAEQAYTQILKFIQQSSYKYPIRFWNNMPAINSGEGDLEKYRQFCTGRYQGFQNSNFHDKDFPAASAVGHHGKDLLVYAICSNRAGEHHRNELQIDAFKYPKEYGKTSPSFARATSLKMSDQQLFFISGTSSIIGHETVHQGNLIGQLETTKKNILQLLNQVEMNQGNIQTMKVYIRHPEDFSKTENYLDDQFPQCQKVYLHADICRKDLLIEIECFCA